MKSRFIVLLTLQTSLVWGLLAQVPTVQIKVKEKSGFLGMGGPRIITLALSTPNHKLPLTSDNVNAGAYYYFLCTPAGDWKIDADFVKEDLAKLTTYQNEQRFQIGWKSDIFSDTTTYILLGFPKSLKLHQLFLFQCASGDGTSQAEMKVPQELWPGYSLLVDMNQQADDAAAAKQYRTAISMYEQMLENASFRIFPQVTDARDKRTKTFDIYLTETTAALQSLFADQKLDLKEKIAQVDKFKPSFRYFLDSIPRPSMNIGSLDPSVAPMIDRARNALASITTARDSMQRALDDKNVRWILEGAATGKNGYLYQYMIETLAYAYSNVNFADTSAADLKVRISDELQARLVKHSITESYETFLRLTNERYQTHLPMFPLEFLPNLRKDTSVFPLPYYSMLKAVNDYFYGSLQTAKEEVFRIFRTCYDQDITAKFDQMRVYLFIREERIPSEVMKLIDDAEQLESRKDTKGALEKYQQANIIAPTFAYGFYALGRYFVRSGEPIRAINFFQRAYQIDTLYLSAYREACNMYLKQANYKPIIEVLTLALQRGNDYWEVNSNLGNAFLGDNDPARAIQSFEKALSLNPKSYRTNIQLGLAYQNVKNYQKAREYFNKAIDLNPMLQDAVDYLSKLNELQRNAR